MYQLIVEPTYITEHSSSTLDLLIVNDHRNIVFSEIGAPLLNQTRYHLPIIGFLNHYIEHSTIIRRKIFLYDRGDYNSYRQKLSTIDWDSMLTGHDIDSITCSIKPGIHDASFASKSPFKFFDRIYKKLESKNLNGLGWNRNASYFFSTWMELGWRLANQKTASLSASICECK